LFGGASIASARQRTTQCISRPFGGCERSEAPAEHVILPHFSRIKPQMASYADLLLRKIPYWHFIKKFISISSLFVFALM
jgi:hypothetical protein